MNQSSVQKVGKIIGTAENKPGKWQKKLTHLNMEFGQNENAL